MGSSSSSSSKQVLLLGLPNSGKTTFLQRLTDSQANESDQINYDPTLGVNYTSLTINSLNFDFWDLGGDKVSATLWSTYYRIIHVGIVLFFFDISDISSFNESLIILLKILNEEELKQARVFLIFNYFSEKNVVMEESKLNELKDNATYYISMLKQYPIHDYATRVDYELFDVKQSKISDDFISKCLGIS